jgi:hypothetical protein
MDNIADNIQVELVPDPMRFGSRIMGKHIVQASIPVETGVQYQDPPRALMEDMVKAKVVAYFYGPILQELEKFRNKHCNKMEYESVQALTKIMDKIYEGRMVDNNELD